MKKLKKWLFDRNKQVTEHNRRNMFGRVNRKSKGAFGGKAKTYPEDSHDKEVEKR